MCLYPQYMLNPKFKPNKKNNFNPPECTDKRIQYIQINCGKCKECMEEKAKSWKTRIYAENKYMDKGTKIYFITLTFDEEHLEEISKKCRWKDDKENAIAATAVKQLGDNWKYHQKETFRHFIVPEQGHNNTERLHLHGIVWTKSELPENMNERNTYIQQTIWKNGYVKFEDIRNIDKCTNYIVKYITKVDRDHTNWFPKILVSRGLGKKYTEDKVNKEIHKYKGDETIKYVTNNQGNKMKLPDYFKKKLWTEEQRNEMWINQIEKNVLILNGQEFKADNTEEVTKYFRILKQLRKQAKQLGYLSPEDYLS